MINVTIEQPRLNKWRLNGVRCVDVERREGCNKYASRWFVVMNGLDRADYGLMNLALAHALGLASGKSSN